MSDPDPTPLASRGSWSSQRVGPADLGTRLVVRALTGGVGPSGSPELTDVVGVLEEIAQPTGEGAQTWQIRKRDDSQVSVDSSQVVVVKRLSDPPTRLRRAVDITTRDLEELAAAGVIERLQP